MIIASLLVRPMQPHPDHAISRLKQRRTLFLEDMRAKTKSSLVSQFEQVLDDFIEWSTARPRLRISGKMYQQAVVTFQRVSDNAVFWSAYPQANSRTKLAILPHSERAMAQRVKSKVRAVLEEITPGTAKNRGVFQVRFRDLVDSEPRQRLKQLLEELLVDYTRT